MKKLLNVVVVWICFYNLHAQQNEVGDRLNSVFLEVGGVGGYYSINYQRIINFNKHWGMNLGIGFSPQLTYGFITHTYMPGLPIQLKCFYRLSNKHLFDFGIAGTPGNFGNGSIEYLVLFIQAGYKYLFSNDKFYLGMSINPAFYDVSGLVFEPWAGIRFGYNFNKLKHKNCPSKTESKFKQNFSAAFGPLNPKIRFQYERTAGVRSSYGIAVSAYYFGLYGYRGELFVRRYSKKHGNTEGAFIQGKMGCGYLYSGLNQIEERRFGFSFGGGIAGGYKLLIGTHLNIETIVGIHYYIPPIVSVVSEAEKNKKNDWWYSTTGFPLDFQFKLGWQY